MNKTETDFYCRECLHTGQADMDAQENVTCAMCDSPNVIREERRIAELRAEREAANLAEDARIEAERPAREARSAAIYAAMDAEHLGGLIACGAQRSAA